jgi:V/A-type H+-transporting ATPase subunit I
MALGVASIVLADLANELGSKAGSLVLGVAIGGLIHVLNLSISLFSPTIHSLRLNYVEFLPKFFSPDGKSYEPFKKEVV